MKELIIATRNKEKLREIKLLLKGLRVRIKCLLDYENAPTIKESGRTFEENASLKALKTANFFGKLSLGEDSGLEVEALGGRPGILSARFAGEEKDPIKNNLKLLRLLEGVPLEKRKARFVCAVALAEPGRVIAVKKGFCYGYIGFEMRGKSGFGYDPLFIVPQFGKTFAELGVEVKNRISHRARAIEKIKPILKKLLEG